MEQNMDIKISGVDEKSGLDLCDGDLKIYIRFLRLYISNMPTALDKIRSVSEETLKDYTVAVHGIKGLSQTIGAEEARSKAKHLEEMGKGGNLAGILAENTAFITYAEKLIDGIRTWLEKHDALLPD